MPLFGRRGKAAPPPGGPPSSAPGDDPGAAGWDAIDAALRGVYGDTEPFHMAPLLSPSLGGDGALHGLSAYPSVGHWHFVTYGLSSLFEPGSGWGIELTFRIPRGGEERPPEWPIAVLNDLAAYVDHTGNLLLPGDWMETPGPITGYPSNTDAPPTGLTCVAFVLDPQLGEIATPHGPLTFVQVVGITLDERHEMEADSDAVLGRLLAADPLLVTDVARA